MIDFVKIRSSLKKEEVIKSDGHTSDFSKELMPITSLKALKKALERVEMGKVIQYATGGQFSMHELLTYLLYITGKADVTFCTWTITETPARAVKNLMDNGLIGSLTCLLDHRVKIRAAKQVVFLENIADKVVLTKVHAKVTLIENEDWAIAVISSANFSKNLRLEAGAIFCDRESVAFHKRWILNAIDGNPIKDLDHAR